MVSFAHKSLDSFPQRDTIVCVVGSVSTAVPATGTMSGIVGTGRISVLSSRFFFGLGSGAVKEQSLRISKIINGNSIRNAI